MSEFERVTWEIAMLKEALKKNYLFKWTNKELAILTSKRNLLKYKLAMYDNMELAQMTA
jgi:uncharacterized protein YjfI (DUF2170 family)